VVAFDVGGGLPLAFARGAAVAALLSAFGSLVFRAVVLPKVAARTPQAAETARSLACLAQGSLVAAAVLLPVWGLLQSADLADAGYDGRRVLAAVPDVLESTVFGHVLLAQFLAASAAAWAARRRPRAALGLSAVALLLQAGHGHALSMEGGPSLLLLAGLLHLLAAGAWVGGLWPLLIVVRDMPPRVGALAARWFSPLGKACVVGMVLSSAVQFAGLVGGVPGLAGTPYGWVAGAKLGLLGVLFAFAVANRYRLAPALMRDAPEAARRTLLRAIAVQTGFGVLTVLAAGILSSLPPGCARAARLAVPAAPQLCGHGGCGPGRRGLDGCPHARRVGGRAAGAAVAVHTAPGAFGGNARGVRAAGLARRAASVPAARGGLPDQLLYVPDWLRGGVHHAGRRALPGTLRALPRRGGPRRRAVSRGRAAWACRCPRPPAPARSWSC